MAIGKPPAHVPNVEPLHLPKLIPGFRGDLDAGETAEGLSFADLDTANDDLSRIALSECEFTNWSADATDFSTARITEVRIEQLKATELNARRNVWREVEITQSRVGALDLFDSTLSHVAFTGCKLAWVSAHSAAISDVVFRNCQIGELDLTGAKLERVAFENTRIDRLVLIDSRSEYLNLCGAELRQIDGLDALSGVMISRAQAVLMADLLATRLGATVMDE